MKTRDDKKQNWSMPKNVFRIFLVLILAIYTQLLYLTLAPTIYGKNLKDFATKRNTYKTVLTAKRGNIYDNSGSVLATNVASYTVIAYLNPSRTGSSKIPKHIVDKRVTAKALAPIINMKEDTIYNLLNQNLYQVELGPGGRGITQLKKEEIEALNLPGIAFTEDSKRYYPNGDFASYILGYAKKNDKGSIIGELGIESLYNKELSGVDGSLEYQQDRLGYKIPDTPENKVDATNGDDIYLTIDSNIQRFLETAVGLTYQKDKNDWMVFVAMEAKTGKILGAASSPSFSPNTLNITNYENPFVSMPFEPGSTMKPFTYMCAIDKGVYDGNDTYSSGSFKVGSDSIYDWNKYGWGKISFDTGIQYSSNTGIANLITRYLNKNELKACFLKYGFGSKTGIELSQEVGGYINFNYQIELLTAGFGQGITTTSVQHLQALSIIANNGTMIKPHIVSSIVDPNTKEIVYKSEVDKVENIVSKETAMKVRDLMYLVVNNKINATSAVKYAIADLNVAGKTGTAQIYDAVYGYQSSDYVSSFSGIFPKDDPQIIIYAAEKRSKNGGSSGLVEQVRGAMQDIAKYKNILNNTSTATNLKTYKLASYLSNNLEATVSSLTSMGLIPIVIGNGDKIIDQYPKQNTTIIEGDKIFLITNGNEYKMPNMNNWSKNEALLFFNITSTKYEIEGSGYVNTQSVQTNTVLNKDMVVRVELKDKFTESNGDN